MVKPLREPVHDSRIHAHALIDNLRAGGAELLLAHFADAAEAVGVDLTVATLEPIHGPSPAADRLRSRGVEPSIVLANDLLSVRDHLRVRRHLAAVRPHILHTHLGTSDLLGNLAARSLSIPSVSTIHANWWPRDRRDRAKTYLISQARRRCTAAVIAVSESARTAYLDGNRDRPEHVVVVHNGIGDQARPGSGRHVRRELGLDPADLVVTMLSTLRPEKNFEGAIGAVASLGNDFPAVRLVIAGTGPYEAAVRERAAALGPSVLVVSHREDVMSLLDATDVVLQPSYFDAFPTTLLEASAASVPAVATATGGIVEIVEHGVTGVLVPPPPTPEALSSALAPLLRSRELRLQLGREARQRFERRFTARRWAEQLRAVYEQALAGGPVTTARESEAAPAAVVR